MTHATKISLEDGAPLASDLDRPLEELGLLQLATRLGKAIEQRRALSVMRAGPGLRPVLPVGEDFGASEPPDLEFEAAEAEPETPAHAADDSWMSLNTLGLDDGEDGDEEGEDDHLAAFSSPFLKNYGVGEPADDDTDFDTAFDEEEDPEDLESEEEYSSLLEMKRAYQRKGDPVPPFPEEDESDIEATPADGASDASQETGPAE